jgi:tRNA(Arg) A34 adenosine deaminase TadA
MAAPPIRLALPAWIADDVDPARSVAGDEARVDFAIRLARRNVAEGTGGPFGAAVFDAAGRVVAAGVNRVLPESCSLAHAETMALMAAQARLGRHRLNANGERFVLATSAQPCCQCYGAVFWAGIDELLVGARSSDVMELSAFDEGPLPADWIGELERRGIRVRRDILRGPAREVFVAFARAGGGAY